MGLGSLPKSGDSHRLPHFNNERVLERILCHTRTRTKRKFTMQAGMDVIANAKLHRLMSMRKSIVNASIVQHVLEMQDIARNVSITTDANAPAAERQNFSFSPSITSMVEGISTTARLATSPGGLYRKDFQTASRCYA